MPVKKNDKSQQDLFKGENKSRRFRIKRNKTLTKIEKSLIKSKNRSGKFDDSSRIFKAIKDF